MSAYRDAMDQMFKDQEVELAKLWPRIILEVKINGAPKARYPVYVQEMTWRAKRTWRHPFPRTHVLPRLRMMIEGAIYTADGEDAVLTIDIPVRTS